MKPFTTIALASLFAVACQSAATRAPVPRLDEARAPELDSQSHSRPPRLSPAQSSRAQSSPAQSSRVQSSPPIPKRDVERTTMRLRGGLHSPMPGGYIAGYQQDTGLDIGGFRLPVYAVAAGTLDYSEPGHTRWSGDDDKAVRLRLDVAILVGSRKITHIWYAHLYELVHHQPEGAEHRIRVVAGERLGTSGIANSSPHLHLGFLLDDQVRQWWGTYLLADEIREVLGNYRMKERLPVEKKRQSRRAN